jgi:hypothetical protein
MFRLQNTAPRYVWSSIESELAEGFLHRSATAAVKVTPQTMIR